MIIDFHAHIAGGELFGTQVSERTRVLADMDANGIGLSVLLPLDALAYQSINENDRISEWVRASSGRFEGLGTLFARRPEEAMVEMDRCLDQLGLLGFKFHPWLQAFSPLEDPFLELAAAANKRRTLFFFHDGTPPYTEPFQIAEVARRNPDLIVVMGHTGLNDLWRESLLAAKDLDNVWLCLSACPHWGMIEVIRQVDSNRIVWGSDYPLANRLDTRSRIRQIEHLPIPDGMKEKIWAGNARELLRLLKSRRASG